MVPCTLKSSKWVTVLRTNNTTRRKSSSMSTVASFSHPPLKVAVLGAGFAGLSVVWNLLKFSPQESHLSIDLYDESGIGGGASGVAGGLLHPYSPKAKLLWQGAECWKECLNLISAAEAAVSSRKSILEIGNSNWSLNNSIVCRRGIVRPAMDAKNLDVLTNNAKDCLQDCRIESLSNDAARNLVPNLCVPFNSVFYMPEALTIHPLHYLQALFFSCEDLVESNSGCKELHLHKKSIEQLCDLAVYIAGPYDAVIVCLGAKVDFLPELSGRLPLRTCRGVITYLQLSNDFRESYPDYSPSILSSAWLAFSGPRSLYVGSTWEWRSRNFSRDVSPEDASQALQELLPKAAAVYLKIDDWTFIEAKAGLRAMPPHTSHGSLPLLGRIDEYVERDQSCKYWLFGGLGARGLLYHGLLGKLMAQAVLSGDESSLPSELTSWKKLKS